MDNFAVLGIPVLGEASGGRDAGRMDAVSDELAGPGIRVFRRAGRVLCRWPQPRAQWRVTVTGHCRAEHFPRVRSLCADMACDAWSRAALPRGGSFFDPLQPLLLRPAKLAMLASADCPPTGFGANVQAALDGVSIDVLTGRPHSPQRSSPPGGGGLAGLARASLQPDAEPSAPRRHL